MRSRLGVFLGTVLFFALAWATWNGFSRGGQDFRVFHYAGRLILDGRWDALYTEGPDRYLYAPGFALLIAPLAALPATPALALWLAGMLAAFAATFLALAKRMGTLPVVFATLFFFRALAIDLRYGQVNVFILATATAALLAWIERNDDPSSRRRLAWSWSIFSIAAFAKIYPLALFLFPAAGIFRAADRRALRIVALASAIGALVLLVPPAFVTGVYAQWFDALARKGLPTDTHNQSLLAFLTRVFGGEPFYALGLGGEAMRFDGPVLSLATMRAIWIAFSLAVFTAVARLASLAGRSAPIAGMAAWLGLALAFLPAHLIWKSYFVLGIPLMAAIFAASGRGEISRRRIVPIALLGFFLAFTSRDFVGPHAAARIESLSPFFWTLLAAVFTGWTWLFPCSSRSSSY